jgi:hypothetical protein
MTKTEHDELSKLRDECRDPELGWIRQRLNDILASVAPEEVEDEIQESTSRREAH